MIDHNLHAGEPPRHVFEHGHLVGKNIKIEYGSETLRFTPQRVQLLRIQPRGLGVINRTEAHPLKAVLLHPVSEPDRWIRIMRIEKTVRHEELWITMQRVADV